MVCLSSCRMRIAPLLRPLVLSLARQRMGVRELVSESRTGCCASSVALLWLCAFSADSCKSAWSPRPGVVREVPSAIAPAAG